MRGTFKASRDRGRIEFDVAVPGSMPQRPPWLTVAGEEIWVNNVGRAVPALTESDSIGFALFCNIVAAIGQAYAAGGVPPIAAMTEARRLGEMFGMMGAQSRVGDKGAIRNGPNPFSRFRRQPDGEPK
jgi:hypothetical protein